MNYVNVLIRANQKKIIFINFIQLLFFCFLKFQFLFNKNLFVLLFITAFILVFLFSNI